MDRFGSPTSIAMIRIIMLGDNLVKGALVHFEKVFLSIRDDIVQITVDDTTDRVQNSTDLRYFAFLKETHMTRSFS